MADYPTGGDDVIIGTDGPDTIDGLEGNDSVDGLAAGDTLHGGAGNDILNGGDGDDLLDGGAGDDALAGGAGEDVLWVLWTDSTENVTTDPYRYSFRPFGGFDGGFTNGAAGSVTFSSIEVMNIWTGSGDDVIEMPGNGGRHDLRSGAGDDVVDIARGVAFADGGEGNDGVKADYSQVAGAVEWDLNAVGGHQGVRGNIVNFEYFAKLFTWSYDDIITTTALALDDMIWTWYGDDHIVVRNGHDYVNASFGSDLLTVEWGGLGGDVAMIFPLHAEFSGGWNGRMGTAEYSVEFVKVDTFHVTTGSGDDVLVVGGGDDILVTGAGNDRLDGGAGDDILTGGAGNDIYVVDSLGDSVSELDGEGMDQIRTGLGNKSAPDFALFVIPEFVENLTGTSAGDQGVRGNGLNNVIVMGAGADLVVLDDGGDDSVDGRGGDDFFYYGAALTGADITRGGTGTDTIGLFGNYTGASAIDFTAANLIGVERVEVYTGAGANSYAITISDSNAAAATEFFLTAASLNSAETLVFNGIAETDARLNVLGGAGGDTIAGGQSSDYLAGNAGNDSIYGLGGADFILGGAGADQLRGGAGGDHFRYSASSDSTAGSVDRIVDFQHIDRIDLSAIDADDNAGDGDTAFTFIGSGVFTNVAGQLRATQSGSVWTVEGDTDGDGAADLMIEVTLVDPAPLGASDFIL